ncbi:MAG: filamentous hemagglutinin N-terminal domain-containing protein [Scytonematopsis contorta HA4267-MV1]|jgi:filamentous hemagglutinin family protein|nr:filamentous hemagglutinin N-terminal domain-containing protein [Scytonematopsis contorta HA4267-MV1]
MKLGFFQGIGISIGSTIIFTSNSALAQITPDATLPNNSQVRLQDNIRFIEGGTQAGSNLFHSFQEFSVPTNITAHFKNTTDIQNILTRVTGGSVSNIDGLIRAKGNANLFLINPSGIIFGQNARLDIGGSFLGSSASHIKFADGSEFNALKPQEKPLLTISAPVGLGMGINPGDIKVFGQGSGIDYETIKKEPRPAIESSLVGFDVKPGKTLALLGGNVRIEGAVLQSSAGRIEIGSVGNNTLINLVPVTEGWKLDYEGVSNFTDIQMSGKALINASGVGGGYISLRGGNVNLTGESILVADTLGNRNAGDISIVGNTVILNRTDASNNTFGTGNAGKIQVIARDSLRFENSGGVGNHTSGLGNAGEITLEADSIIIRNKRSGAGSNTYENATGKAGIVNVKGNSLLIEDNAGFGTRSFSSGDAGVINLEVGDIIIRNESGMGSDTSASGNGGQVNIKANSLLIENKSGFSNRTLETGGGRGGNFNINIKESFIVRNQSGIRTDTFGSGDAGQINLTADYLEISNSSGINAASNGSGNAGNFQIKARTLVVSGGNLGVASNKSGRAGILNITADNIKLDKGKIVATTNSGNGGNLILDVENLLQLNNKSQISTTAGTQQAPGNGGDISIDIPRGFIVAFTNGNSDITANAFTGNGGKITINALNVFGMQQLTREDLLRQNKLKPEELLTNNITAFSQQNPTLDGTVSINTPDVDPNRGVSELPEYIVNAAALINENFCARAYASSFIITGRGGIAPSPFDVFTGETTWEDWRMNPVARRSEGEKLSEGNEKISTATKVQNEIVEAQGWVVNEKGQVKLVAFTSNVTPHSLPSVPLECLLNTPNSKR